VRVEGGGGASEWRHLGVLSAGVIGRCGLGYYTDLNVFVPWIEQVTQVDVTPCHDLEGRWAPTPACLRVSADQGSNAEPASFSYTCGAPYAEVDNGYDPIEVTIDEVIVSTDQGPITAKVSVKGGRPHIRRVRAELLGKDAEVLGVAVDEIPPYELSMLWGEGRPEGLRVVAHDFYGETGSALLGIDAPPHEASAGCAVRPAPRSIPHASVWAAGLIAVAAAVWSRRPG